MAGQDLTLNHMEQGQSRWVVGTSGTLDVPSGGELDIESGGALKIAGTQIDATAAELNYLDITTLGTGAASKAVVLDSGDDYTWPATGILTYGVLNDATTALTATALEMNQLDASAADGCTVAFVDKQLTATNIKALVATNIQLIAAPGANLAIIPVAIHLFLDHGGTDYVQNAGTDALAIKHNGSTEITELATEAQMTTLIQGSADAELYCPLPLAGAAYVPVANKAIDLDNNGATEYATGDGTLSIRLFYRVVRMVAFT